VHTDFVFSAIGEELGLLGTFGVLLLFMLLVVRGFKIALEARDLFGRYLAAGLTSVLAIQTLVIIGGTLRLIPLTGITLPFISAGGSSLLTNFVIVGLLLRISDPKLAG
jgi:cell division protein FtsW (lipid II flippase)